MGPFPIELRKENGTVSLQPRGARDGTRTHDLLITKAGRIYVLFLVAFSNRLSMRLFCVLLFAVYARLSQFLAVINNK